jgi:Domain of unknown function (DUF4430)
VIGARAIATVTATVLAFAAAGCGVGAGETEQGTATLTVTRDYGSELLREARVENPSESETIVRFLDREAEIETSYGGNFVDAIDGTAGAVESGRSLDWFFYVNGYASPVGAGEAAVHAGDRIWWDYRDWTDAYRVPAVVGSYPEPFVSGFNGERLAVEVVCFDVETACDQVAGRLEADGANVGRAVAAEAAGDPDRTLRLLVGSWARVRVDRVAELLERGPAESGVYARVESCGDGVYALQTLDRRARPSALLSEAGWVAALQRRDEQPTWVVSGSESDQVEEAAGLLDQATLARRYAVATYGGEDLGLPTDSAPTPEGTSCR